MTMKNHRNILRAALALVLLALPACGGDDPTIIARPGNGGSGSVEPGSGGTGTGVAGSSAEVTCVESPDAPEGFLNRCTDAACRPFDNAARLSLYRAGEPLPEVP
jgi:hypothetical protein